MAEGGISIKAVKVLEQSTDTLQIPVDIDSGVSDDEQVLLTNVSVWRNARGKSPLSVRRKF